MPELLPTDILKQSLGISVKNNINEPLGEIIEVTFNRSKERPEYIIVKTGLFDGNEDRFFAIPASSAFVVVTEKNNIVLKVSKNDLRLAKRIPANQCPRANMQFAQSIYELYRYEEPKDQKLNSK